MHGSPGPKNAFISSGSQGESDFVTGPFHNNKHIENLFKWFQAKNRKKTESAAENQFQG
jgi:hypothetical protein